MAACRVVEHFWFVKDLRTTINVLINQAAELRKPLAVILAGHNGSGKSTLWYENLVVDMRMPLLNADRFMLAILPEKETQEQADWVVQIRDHNEHWMRVAQQGVQAFMRVAVEEKEPFAMETVFSHWQMRPDGSHASKIDNIRALQDAGYFVVLFFVGLTSAEMSISRVKTRVQSGGHGVAGDKLISRFPRTQKAVSAALPVADAAILVDNSLTPDKAFTLCRVQQKERVLFDSRNHPRTQPPKAVLAWMDKVCPAPVK